VYRSSSSGVLCFCVSLPAHVAQAAEHNLGKIGVTSSSLVVGSIYAAMAATGFWQFAFRQTLKFRFIEREGEKEWRRGSLSGISRT
jgi:hypothetical protein